MKWNRNKGHDPAAAFSGKKYRHPMEVAYHAGLTAEEKLSILRRWRSRSLAVDGAPFLRLDPISGAVASLDEIAEALEALHEERARARRTVARDKALSRQLSCSGAPALPRPA